MTLVNATLELEIDDKQLISFMDDAPLDYESLATYLADDLKESVDNRNWQRAENLLEQLKAVTSRRSTVYALCDAIEESNHTDPVGEPAAHGPFRFTPDTSCGEACK